MNLINQKNTRGKTPSYNQRNIFMYPPSTKCNIDNSTHVDGDVCGVNGGIKKFEASQTTEFCDPLQGGRISGPYGESTTITSLIGDNILLYQIWDQGKLTQSQMTTITHSDTSHYRTRTAQLIWSDSGTLRTFSFYREKRVSRDDFWVDATRVRIAYNISDAMLDERCYGGWNNVRKFIDGAMTWPLASKYTCPLKPAQGGVYTYALWTHTGATGAAAYGTAFAGLSAGDLVTAAQVHASGSTVAALEGYKWVRALTV